MDTNITARIADFRAPPPYPKLEAFEEKPAQGMTPEHLDRLDALAVSMLEARKKHFLHSGMGLENSATYRKLSESERIYVALAVSNPLLLREQGFSIPEAIDRLGWVDASAMVARWRNRRA